MFQLIKHGTRFDIIGKQSMFAILSGIALMISIGLFFGIGPNYGIDFKGGTDIILRFEKDITSEKVRDAAKVAGFKDATVQSFGGSGKNQFMVQTAIVSVVDAEKIKGVRKLVSDVVGIKRDNWTQDQPDRFDLTLEQNLTAPQITKLSEDIRAQLELKPEIGPDGKSIPPIRIEQKGTEADHRYVIKFQDLSVRVREGFANALPETFNKEKGLERMETVGARVGNQLREDGLTAVLLALIAILIYIAVRFDIRYAPGAVAALFHDVVISMGILVAFQIEINLPILAAILTIVGYSLNDTIVVFDRIRENYTAGHGGNTLPEIVNTSLNETLTRTLITSLTTLVAVFAIYIRGAGLIETFALTLIIGVIIGTYSSIAVASPIMMKMDGWVRRRQEARELRARMTAPAEDSSPAS